MPTLTAIELREPIRDTQRVHGIIAAAHPDTRPLWAMPHPKVLLVQADTETRLPARVATQHRHTETTTPQTGATVTISLIANPTQKLADNNNRSPLPSDDYIPWLRRKLSSAITLTTPSGWELIGPRRGNRRGTRVTHTLVAFHATGIVTDRTALAALQAAGIGSGKAYGAGLLIVREVAP